MFLYNMYTVSPLFAELPYPLRDWEDDLDSTGGLPEGLSDFFSNLLVLQGIFQAFLSF